MKKILLSLLIAALACLTGIAAAQTPEPTQTPYIIYVVITATPEPQPTLQEDPAEDIVIKRSDDSSQSGQTDPITIVNADTGTGNTGTGNEITLANPTGYAESVDDLVRMVVATVTAQNQPTAEGVNPAPVQPAQEQPYSNTPPATVNLSDGTTCTMNFQLIAEPTYPNLAIVPRGEIFWKEWLIQNTGTCTWTPEWEFVFDSGWQIGNTRFHMNKTTAPGETLTVRLAMVPDQQDGNYYSTYIFEAPDGTRNGTITSSYTVKPASYFEKPAEETPKQKDKPRWYPRHPWHPWYPWYPCYW